MDLFGLNDPRVSGSAQACTEKGNLVNAPFIDARSGRECIVDSLCRHSLPV